MKRLTPVYIEDKKGWVVYFEEYPDTFDQGKTKEEALKNLNRTLEIVLKYKEQNGEPKIDWQEFAYETWIDKKTGKITKI